MDNLRTAAREAIAANNDDSGPPNLSEPIIIRSADRRTLATILNDLNLNSGDTSKVYENIIIIETYFRSPEHIVDAESLETSQIEGLILWTTNSILPKRIFAERSQFDDDPSPLPTSNEKSKARARAVVGLRLLRRLHEIPLATSLSLETHSTAAVAAASFTDVRDPWTTEQASVEAMALIEVVLAAFESTGKTLDVLLTTLLKERIKPFFAKNKNLAITEQGRKAIQPLPAKFEPTHLESETKPWKHRDVYIVTVFWWILQHLNTSTTEENWPYVIPPLLMLLDDSSIDLKVKGCELLETVLKTTDPKFLERTGLGDVFQDTLMPFLSYLPSLTPEKESKQILGAAYPALIFLSQVRFPNDGKQRLKLLDMVLRQGVIKGYAHAGEHVHIAELLVRQIIVLVEHMGISSVKHLKEVLPLLGRILSAPFATSYPPLLQISVQALRTIIVYDWPRVDFHRGEILRGLVFCWLRIQEEETISVKLTEICKNIESCVILVRSAIQNREIFKEECQTLVASDTRLEELLLHDVNM